MVPVYGHVIAEVNDSPRIRGDGPSTRRGDRSRPAFSPYSRGWSQVTARTASKDAILPVFAGMVPGCQSGCSAWGDSPRIRGDGPALALSVADDDAFSPYSRGWSRGVGKNAMQSTILPVFAGMVPAYYQ